MITSRPLFLWHIDIGYDEIRSGVAPDADGLLAIPGLNNVVPSLTEPDLKRSTDTRIVIDYQNPLLCHGPRLPPEGIHALSA